MRFLFLFFVLFVSGCNFHSNEFFCEFTNVRDMTEREFEMCKAYWSSSDIVVNNRVTSR